MLELLDLSYNDLQCAGLFCGVISEATADGDCPLVDLSTAGKERHQGVRDGESGAGSSLETAGCKSGSGDDVVEEGLVLLLPRLLRRRPDGGGEDGRDRRPSTMATRSRPRSTWDEAAAILRLQNHHDDDILDPNDGNGGRGSEEKKCSSIRRRPQPARGNSSKREGILMRAHGRATKMRSRSTTRGGRRVLPTGVRERRRRALRGDGVREDDPAAANVDEGGREDDARTAL